MQVLEKIQTLHAEQYRQWQEHEARMRQEESDWKRTVRSDDLKWRWRTLAVSVLAVILSAVAIYVKT